MATEALFEVRVVRQINPLGNFCGLRYEYRSKTVTTGLIGVSAALIGVSAWSEWTPLDANTITEQVAPPS